MGLSRSGIKDENHIITGSWIAWLIDDSIGTILSPTILSVPFCPLPFCPRTHEVSQIEPTNQLIIITVYIDFTTAIIHSIWN